jgi:hypothetical protein
MANSQALNPEGKVISSHDLPVPSNISKGCLRKMRKGAASRRNWKRKEPSEQRQKGHKYLEELLALDLISHMVRSASVHGLAASIIHDKYTTAASQGLNCLRTLDSRQEYLLYYLSKAKVHIIGR